jgi:Fe-S cluster biogenesis protein NfuA
MIGKIENVLDKYVRPQLAEHYGDVEVESFKKGTLKIRLLGHCSNCPSARYTVEDVIEKQVKEHIPQVDNVMLIEGVSDDLISFAKKILNKEM